MCWRGARPAGHWRNSRVLRFESRIQRNDVQPLHLKSSCRTHRVSIAQHITSHTMAITFESQNCRHPCPNIVAPACRNIHGPLQKIHGSRNISRPPLQINLWLYHGSTNVVEHSIAPLAWQSLSLIKCQILANLFMVLRFSDVAFLAFWASCGSVWFVRQQGSAVSKSSTTVEELPSLNERSFNKSEHDLSVSSGVTSSCQERKGSNASVDWHLVSFV